MINGVDYRYRFAYIINHRNADIGEAAMFFKKQHGATSEPLTKVRARHESQKRTEKPSGAQVLCDPVMPANWTPDSNSERYQQWAQKKGAAA